jgi:hypothetical protein
MALDPVNAAAKTGSGRTGYATPPHPAPPSMRRLPGKVFPLSRGHFYPQRGGSLEPPAGNSRSLQDLFNNPVGY